ncbi:hypothetical protein CDAR_486481 [Caerostris darwini]|uniref:Secreted protein n=1 Tax=Caerostris darwini TaxID=1538125 RepID=A0AAV4NTU6_9ARAC|nr:hypothetical protein CDAR_486481 [Caerostris darwini]
MDPLLSAAVMHLLLDSHRTLRLLFLKSGRNGSFAHPLVLGRQAFAPRNRKPFPQKVMGEVQQCLMCGSSDRLYTFRFFNKIKHWRLMRFFIQD